MELDSRAIHGFSSTFLWSKFDNPVESPQFHFELWDLMCSDYPRVAVAAPRYHAKSTAVTHCFVLACVLFKIKQYVLIVSDTEGQAVEFLGDIKRELEENEELRSIFGVERILKSTDTDVRCELRGGHQFRIMAFGAEQKIRGRKWRNKRPDLVVCDDLENDEAVTNEERRHKFRTWFLNALRRVGSKSCHFRVVGTILHQDSILSRFMPKLTSPTIQTDGLRFWDPAFEEESGWKSILYQAHNEDFSQILWPENYDRQYFEDIRKEYQAQGHPEGYSQEYLNRPVDKSVAYFRQEDLRPIEDTDEYMDYYVGADLAVSTRDQRAYTAIVVAGLTASGVLKVVDVRRFRGDSLRIVEEMFSVQSRYNPVLFAVESENIAKSIGPFLYEEMGKNGKPFINLRELPTNNKDKQRRARSIQARTRAGKVQFDHTASWWPEFQEELIYFDRGTYFDQVDAFAYIGIMLNDMIEVPTESDIYEESYTADKFMTASNRGRKGICKTTGY
jgi:predicted phage terminase large subunit-like protein